MTTIAERLQACHSSVIHDVMKDLGLPIRVLPRTITGIEPSMKAAGPVFTVRGRPDPTLDKHSSLFEWAGLLSRAPQGHVVVVQPQDDTRALFGGLQVLPDDHVLADRDGIVLIPASHLDEVVSAAERKMSTEGEMVRAIRAGEDPQAAYLRHRVF